jgi:sigma-E factor negative regulatory protein RseB
VALRGRPVFAADPDLRSLSWSAHGFVYTVIAEAPPATVNQVVDALPHDAGPGFWGRIARGLRRLAAMANPFR